MDLSWVSKEIKPKLMSMLNEFVNKWSNVDGLRIREVRRADYSIILSMDKSVSIPEGFEKESTELQIKVRQLLVGKEVTGKLPTVPELLTSFTNTYSGRYEDLKVQCRIEGDIPVVKVYAKEIDAGICRAIIQLQQEVVEAYGREIKRIEKLNLF